MIALEEHQLKERLAIEEITFAIPAQSFGIACSISAEEALPVVTEFALRIIYVCGSMSPSQLQSFFGYTEKETAAVIKALHDERLIKWHDDQLELTAYSSTRFQDSSDNLPRFFKIREWSGEVIFDLISYSSAEKPSRLRRPRALVQLNSHNVEKESKTIQWAEKAFQENFRRICRKDKAEIYKITEVTPGERFMIPLPCVFHLSLDNRIEIRREIDDESFGERLEIAQAISDAIANLDDRDNDHFENFIEIFEDDLLRQFIAQDTFDLRRYVQEVHITEKVSYQNSKVVPILGSLHLLRNQNKILEWTNTWARLDDSEEITPIALSACWLGPKSRLWARSRAASAFIRKINQALANNALDEDIQKQGGVKTIIQLGRDTPNGLAQIYSDIFPKLFGTQTDLLGGNIEIFLLPDRFVCALFHFHLDNHPISVPIGFLSSDPFHLEAAKDLIARRTVERYGIIALSTNQGSSTVVSPGEFAFIGVL